MKKFVIAAVMLMVTVGLFADITHAMRFRIDSLSFGNVAADGYKLGQSGSITPQIEYSLNTGSVGFAAKIKDQVNFKGGATENLFVNAWFNKKVADDKGLIATGAWYNTSGSDATHQVAAWVSYAHNFSWGYIFGSLDIGYEENKGAATIGFLTNDSYMAGVNSDFMNRGLYLGASAKFGLYGYVNPKLTFAKWDANGDKTKFDPLSAMDIRVGFKAGPTNTRVTLTVPTGTAENKGNFASVGLGIRPRFTYTIVKGLTAYADLNINKIGADGAKVGWTPSLGVLYVLTL
jgi:hypothetical protein